MGNTKPHTVELKELQEWLQSAELIFASSSRERKKLVAVPTGGFIVYVAGEVKWMGIQPFSAVEAYNSITEKYKEEKSDFVL